VYQANLLRSNPVAAGKASGVGLLVFFLCVLAGAGASAATKSPAYIFAGAVLGVYFLLGIKVVDQWERVAVLRFGRYRGLRGPGVFLIVPIVDTYA